MTARIRESDRRQAEPALLDRDAARLVEQRLPVAGTHNERVHGAQHFQRAVQPLDAPLLRLERPGLLEQLVDHDAQMLPIEIGRDLRRRPAA